MNYFAIILVFISLNVCLILCKYGQQSANSVERWRTVRQTTRQFTHTTNELKLTKKVRIDGKPCNDQHLVSVFIHSAGRSNGKYFERRQTLRNTWVNELKNFNISVYFAIALNENETINKELKEESDRYEDMIQFGFIDDYKNLTLKAISILRWIHNKCQNSTYILKTDDDAVVNTPILLEKLSQFKTGISGNLGRNVHPYRDPNSRWFVPLELYPNDTYPDYVSGGAYMMAGNITYILLKTIEEYSGHVFIIDDLFITGFVAEKARIARHWTGLIAYVDCNARLCALYERAAIFECKDTEEIKKFWSQWKSTSYDYCPYFNVIKIVGITVFGLTLVIIIIFACYSFFRSHKNNTNMQIEAEMETFIEK